MSTQYPVYKDKPIDQWKVTELKDELRRRKLKMNGLKDELVRRLDEALRSEMTPDTEEELANSVDPDNDSQNVDQSDSEKNLEQPPAEINAEQAEDHSEIVEDAAMADDDSLDANLGTGGHDEKETGDTTVDVAVEETSDNIVTVNSVTDDQSVVTLVQPNNPEANHDEMMQDSKPPEDVKLTLSESTNQVSEVSQDLVSQVNCESISSDSVSINKNNGKKDNLNANIVHLELEVVNPEVVQPSSSDVPTIDVDLHPLDKDNELVDNHGSLEDVDDVTCTTEVELYKKIDSGDGESPEKLSLDRSSGDDSMEEDVLESKQTESKDKSVDVGERNEDKKVEVVQEVKPVDALVGEFSHEEKDRVSEDGIAPVEKRKAEGQEAAAMPKRQRRWNSETIKISEPQTVNITSTPKDVFHPTFRRSLSRTDSSLSGEAPKERIVPPPVRAATTSLRINNFLRPFTLKAVQELLSQTGTFSDFWMDHIKTHCYVTYSSVEEAVATRSALYNLPWPPNGGRLLTAEYVDPQEVKSRLEAPRSSAPVTPTPTTTAPAAPLFQPQARGAPPPRHPLKQEQLPPPPLLPPSPALSKPPPVWERLPPPAPLKKPELPIVTLDDIFRKTTATPRIYYLPLSEEQVAAKLVAQGNRAQKGQ